MVTYNVKTGILISRFVFFHDNIHQTPATPASSPTATPFTPAATTRALKRLVSVGETTAV